MGGRPGRADAVLAVFAEELKLARNAAGLTQEQLAVKIAYSTALVGAVETCRRVASRDFALRCDEVLGTGGVLGRLHRLVAGHAYPSWFRPFVELEAGATSLRSWEPLLVPGLLQIEHYATAVLRAARPADPDDRVQQDVGARMERQAVLASDEPPMLWTVLDESVLRRPIGGPQVMYAQLAYLAEAAEQPKIMIQVMPLGVGAHTGLTGGFVIATFRDGTDSLYVETASAGLIVGRPEAVASCAFNFDALRAEALSSTASLDRIRKVMKEWT
ncbi:MAG TPA: helix-turn-helix transcriptional regulator [Streptosporangiaceae bacterium]|nr:helix-turn-helix transcriptional regulator [Streptosporangiaceae bacterium]